MTIISCTGHRPNRLGNEYNYIGPYTKYVYKQLSAVMDQTTPSKVISGMALGVDTIWAKLAIEKNIPLIAAIPFDGQSLKWATEQQKTYINILDQAFNVHIVNLGGYDRWKVFERDNWMVDNCDCLVAIWNGDQKTGTSQTINYANRIGLEKIYTIDPEGWKDEVA